MRIEPASILAVMRAWLVRSMHLYTYSTHTALQTTRWRGCCVTGQKAGKTCNRIWVGRRYRTDGTWRGVYDPLQQLQVGRLCNYVCATTQRGCANTQLYYLNSQRPPNA